MKAPTYAAIRRGHHLVGTVPFDGGSLLIAFDRKGKRIWAKPHWMRDDKIEGMEMPVVVEPPGREIVCAGPETIPDFWRAYAIGGKKLPPLPPALD